MSGHAPQDVNEQAVDRLVRDRYGVEPGDDRSGMLLPSEPFPVDATEDEQFAAVMGRYFPGSVAS